jgi:SNF family Na+-dependent transporter
MVLVQYLKKAAAFFAPPTRKSSDGRDQWPSRTAFLLAAMGGCAGQGNLLQYPSVVYNNYRLQWFVPYLLAVFLIAIPALILEISIGQAYRGGTVIAFNNVNKLLKGVGLVPVLVSFIVVQYFTVNLAWVMNCFRHSFTSPLPWEGRIFFTLVVLGFSSAFVMLDAAATMLVDSGLKYSRTTIVTALTVLSFLLCLPYCTQFGYYLLDGIDRWINNLALIFVVWTEVMSATTLYRWSDVTSQTGFLAFIRYNGGYFNEQILGISVGHGINNIGAGAGVGIGF